MAAPFKSKAVAFSEKLYGRMLLAYPRAHRAEFGPCMAQLFRDQCRDAWSQARSRALLKLWLRVLPDVIATSLLEHFTALNERKSMFNRTLFGRFAAPLSTFFAVFTLVFLLVLGASVLITFILPESFMSTARIKVERDLSEAPARTDAPPAQSNLDHYSSYDPYFIQTEFEVIQSEVVLGRVIETLNLNAAWGRKYGSGGSLKTSESMDLLRRQLDLRPVRNTSLIEIRAFSDKPEEAAKIANAVAEAYQAHRLEQNRVFVLSSIKALEAQWSHLRDRLVAAQDQVDKLRVELKVPVPEPAQGELLPNYQPYAEARQQLEELRQFRTVLGMKIAEEQVDLTLPKRSMVEIIDHAVPNLKAVRPNKPLNMALGALLGVVLGAIAGAGSAGISLLVGRNSRNRPAVS